MNVERDVMEYEIVIVGAGPAGLACAIRLKQLRPEVNVCVLEKGSAVGAHSLSGAVMELLLASYAGAFTSTPPSPPSEYGVYRPAFVDASQVRHTVLLPGGDSVVVPHPEAGDEVAIEMPPPPADWIDDGPKAPRARLNRWDLRGASFELEDLPVVYRGAAGSR